MKPEMASTLRDVVRGAFARGFLTGVRTAAAELMDILLAPLRRDPLSPRRPDRPSPKSTAALPSLQDWRTALRRARSHPGYCVIVVGVLALVIAANTVVFSVADSAMFRGLPYPNGSRIYELFNADADGNPRGPGLTPATFDEWRRHTEVFEALEAFGIANFLALGNGEPEQIGGAVVTPGLFAALGAHPARGRLFEPRDVERDGGDLAIISDAVWHRRFGGADDIAGGTLTLNDRPFTIVGVMPPHFRFPSAQHQVWVVRDRRQMPGRLQTMALLNRGLRNETAQERLDTIAAALAAERPQPQGWRVRLMSERGMRLNPWTRSALQVLTMAVLAVLLIACANLANLAVAQALARRQELAIRAALGASRWRLVRELLAEHLLLGAAGGIGGLLLAWWGVQVAIAMAPDELTIWTANEIRIDGRILAFTALITIASTVLFGIFPAWRASRAEAGDALKTRTGSGVHYGRLRTLLVVAEVAISVVLLTGAALLIRSFTRLTHLEPGFDPRGLTTLSLQVPTDRYPLSARREYIDRIAQTLRAMPGVESVSASNGIPTDGGSIHFGRLEVEGSAPDGDVVLPDAHVDPAYFSTMKIRLLAGRGFTNDEPETSAVVSESLAQRLGGAGALGRRFRVEGFKDWWTVVGIAAEVRQSRRLERDGTYEMYTPMWRRAAPPPAPAAARPAGGTSRSFDWIRMTIRTAGAPPSVAQIKAAVWNIDPAQPVADVLPVDEVLALSLSQDRFGAVLMGTFAALALMLAAAGLYAVLAQLVAQRRQEIGIRIALGASTADVARLIVGRGIATTAVGIAIGIAAAWLTSHFLANQLYEVHPHDPVSFATVPAVLFVVALLASWLPARRALTVDPIETLRAE
jgi:putative ABC transport system permease protein